MIQGLDIKNFKPLKDNGFVLRNLNVLLGLNGQGKSSFIQALLLLRQSDIPRGSLNLRGELFNVGSPTDLRYAYAKDFTVSIDLEFASRKSIKCHFDSKKGKADFIFSPDNLSIIKQESLFNDNFQYLNADRIEPKTLHPKILNSLKPIGGNLGIKGEYTAHYLETHSERSISFENCLHPKTLRYQNNRGKTQQDNRLISQANLWLGEISPGVQVKVDSISSDRIELGYQFESKIFKSKVFKPENVGFGISYVLHVITALLSAKPGGLVIIENPESHLHPKGAGKLGELIARVAKNDIQIVIETHSANLLNGIRLGIKEKIIPKNKVVLHHFEKRKDNFYASIESINVMQDGRLGNDGGLRDNWIYKQAELTWDNFILKSK